MTPSQIKKTKWAREFRENAGWETYQDALGYALLKPCEVTILKTDEVPGVKWAIAYIDTAFWMDGFYTKKECTDLCHVMGWRIVK